MGVGVGEENKMNEKKSQMLVLRISYMECKMKRINLS